MLKNILKFFQVWIWLGLMNHPRLLFCIRNHKGTEEADKLVLGLMKLGVEFKYAFSSAYAEQTEHKFYVYPVSNPNITIWIRNYPYAWGDVRILPFEFPYWLDKCEDSADMDAKLELCEDVVGTCLSKGVAIQFKEYLDKQGIETGFN